MATNSKNSQKNNYTNGLPTNKLFHKIGMSMMSIVPILLAAQVSTLEVPNQNQSVESRSNELEYAASNKCPAGTGTQCPPPTT